MCCHVRIHLPVLLGMYTLAANSLVMLLFMFLLYFCIFDTTCVTLTFNTYSTTS